MSVDKYRKFWQDLNGGKLPISKGMVKELSREFSQKSKKELKKNMSDVLMYHLH